MKKTILITEIVSELDQGMTDEQLMTKYRLSRDSLERLFFELTTALSNGSFEIEIEPGE